MNFKPVEWFERLDSTNAHLQQMFRDNQDLANATVIAAREQTAGRGRNDRHWLTTAGKDLAFSFLCRSDLPPSDLVALPLVVGLGLAEALESLGFKPELKWPNDLLVQGKKICGILAEQVHNHPSAVIVGIGLNVNMEPPQAEKIDQPATSLYIEQNKIFSPDQILQLILDHLAHTIDRWQGEGFPAIAPEWLERCPKQDQPISITNTSGQTTHGIMSGLGPQGQLLITDHNGTTHSIWSGDVGL